MAFLGGFLEKTLKLRAEGSVSMAKGTACEVKLVVGLYRWAGQSRGIAFHAGKSGLFGNWHEVSSACFTNWSPGFYSQHCTHGSESTVKSVPPNQIILKEGQDQNLCGRILYLSCV